MPPIKINSDDFKKKFSTQWVMFETCVKCSGEYLLQTQVFLTRQHGRHFSDDTFKCIFVNENFCILIEISLKSVLKGPIDNNPALV